MSNQLINHILVVCVGNICRSPMAQALFQQQHSQLQVASAGLQALVNEKADEQAILVMDIVGLNIRNHRAQQLNTQLMLGSDLVLCMSRRQEIWIKQHWVSQSGKVYRLGHWINEDIIDPYHQPIETFYDVRDVIIRAVQSWQDKIH